MLGLERNDGPKTQRFAAVVNDGLLLRMVRVTALQKAVRRANSL